MTTDPQDALASLRQWQLEQDNSGRFRVYRDQHGQIYHSVTHILKNTAPQSQKDALERWSQRAGSALERDLACDRGTVCLLYTSPSPRDMRRSRMPSSA